MSLTVRTNIASMMSAGQLGRTNGSLSHSLARVSSGLRITKAADDAAGLGVATNLQAAARSTGQAMRNANDGISIIQTAEGASNEVVDILQRMRELAVQSSSETLENDERDYISDEYQQLRSEIGRISSVTEFNGLSLADDSLTGGIDVQVGIENDSSSQINIQLGDLRVTSLGLTTSTIELNTSGSAQAAIDAIDTALDTVNQYRSTLGSVQNRIDSAINNAQVYQENLVGAASNIQDADYAEETSEMTKFQIMQQAGIAALSQAKNMNQAVISLLS
jgi:flagellin